MLCYTPIMRHRIFFWIPRGLGILFTIFLVLLSFDVFGKEVSLGKMLLGFFISLLPAAVVFITLLIAWKKPFIGGVIFIALGFLYMVVAISRVNWTVQFIVSGPLFLTGIFFLIDWNTARKRRRKL